MLNVSYQKANDEASYEGGDTQSDFISANASYSYSIVPSSTTLAIAANYYATNAAGVQSNYWGPTVIVTKALLKKSLRCSWAGSYNETSGTVETSPVLNNRLNFSYSPVPDKTKEKEVSTQSHHLSLSANLLNRLKRVEAQPAFTELTITFNYAYTF